MVPPTDCTTSELMTGLAPGQQCSITVEFNPAAGASGQNYSGLVGVDFGMAGITRNFQASVQ
jgi:hypothetical protein